MRLGFLAKKMFSLLGTLRNPFFFLYRVCHYLNRYVPHRLATFIYHRNIKDYKKEGVRDFLLDTYDGGGQAVHPDIVYYNNLYWLTITPYPYGMEEYENPCLYQGKNLNNLALPKGPIAVQKEHTQGVHLSDPCFAVDDNKLYCYYRESERKGNIEEHTIWEIPYCDAKKSWGDPKQLMCSVDDKLLSPAMVYKEPEVLTIYYVSSLNDNYTLVSTNKDAKGLTKHNVCGMPSGYYLWHIGISKVKDLDNKTTDNGLLGLFLMESMETKGGMKLFEARNDGSEPDWHITREVLMPDEIKEIVAFPYKSCYIPNGNGAILLSFRDKKSRNRLIILNGKR